MREAQALLTDLNYSPGPIDGILGSQTLRALHDFQRTNGLTLTQSIDLNTLRLLRVAGGTSRVKTGVPNVIPASRAPPLDRGLEISSISGGAAPMTVTGEPVASTARSSEPVPIVRAGQAVGLFILTVITTTLVLGLLALLAAIDPTIERVWPFMLRRARSLLAAQAEMWRSMLLERPFSDGLNRSFLGRTVATGFRAIGSSKPLRAAARHLQSLASDDRKSRFRECANESVRYRKGTSASRDLDSCVVRYPRYTDFPHDSARSPSRHHLHRSEIVDAASLGADDAVSVEPGQPQAQRDAPPLEDTPPPSRDSVSTCAQSVNAHEGQPPCAAIIKSDDASLPAVQESLPRQAINESTRTHGSPVRKRSLIGDPLASLSVHLAFERFDEAEELAKNAVEQYPERHEYRLRLLQVYHAVGNRVGFEYHAKALSAAVGSCSPMMAMVADWWRDLAPNEDLFTTPQSQVSSPDESIQQEVVDDQKKPVVPQ
nr:peptidoglycan-binding protein [Gammaproteobacteria bacterium]